MPAETAGERPFGVSTDRTTLMHLRLEGKTAIAPHSLESRGDQGRSQSVARVSVIASEGTRAEQNASLRTDRFGGCTCRRLVRDTTSIALNKDLSHARSMAWRDHRPRAHSPAKRDETRPKTKAEHNTTSPIRTTSYIPRRTSKYCIRPRPGYTRGDTCTAVPWDGARQYSGWSPASSWDSRS